MAPNEKSFSQIELEAIARALGDTVDGLTGSEISHLLECCRMLDPSANATKWIRIHDAFVTKQNTAKNRRAILAFIRQALAPSRHLRQPEKFETLRANVNRALAFSGLAVLADGKLVESDKVNTLKDAVARAGALRVTLESREIHPDVLACCRAELLADNYFHAVLEATKSVAEKIRKLTGLPDDGTQLMDRAFGGSTPILRINPLSTPSEESEQRGFLQLLRGIVGMFRNPAAHELKISWEMSKADAEDLMSLLSLIHRRLDRIYR